VVEGPILARHKDVRHDALEIIEDFACCNPQCLKAGFGNSRITRDIALWVVAHRMRLAIHFDAQSPVKADKIDDVIDARELTTKTQAAGALTELLPKHDLGESQLTAKLARTTDIRTRSAHGAVLDAS
jgi:hypothetical protein